MFHTAELGKHIGWREFRRIKANCAPYRDGDGNEVQGRYFFERYSDNGLTFIYYEPKEGAERCYPWMKVIVNFAKLLKEAEQIALPGYDEAEKLLQLYNAYMETACMEQRQLDYTAEEDLEQYQCNTIDLRVQRLDCTMQVSGLTKQEINGYIYIYSHSYRKGFDRLRPRGMSQYDKWGNLLRGERKGSAYFASNEIGVNIYDKQQQMLNVNESRARKGKQPKYDAETIEKASGILRIEFQCYPGALRYRMNKINKFKKKGITCLRTLENVLNAQISEDIIFSYLERLAWKQPHINLRSAEKIIDNKQRMTGKVKVRLLQILRAGTIKGRRMHEVKSFIDEPKYFTADLKKIRDLGFNPILLPINGYPSNLENLYNVLKQQTKLWGFDTDDLHEDYAPSGDYDVFEEYTTEELAEDEDIIS